jgi:hypothetical protein
MIAPGAPVRIEFFWPPGDDVGPICVTPHPTEGQFRDPRVATERVGKTSNFTLGVSVSDSPSDIHFAVNKGDPFFYFADFVADHGVAAFDVDVAWGF